MEKALQFGSIVAITTGLAVALIFFARAAVRKAKNSPRTFSGIYWAFLFFSSGRMPPPPPQEYTQEELRQKKTREGSRVDPDL